MICTYIADSASSLGQVSGLIYHSLPFDSTQRTVEKLLLVESLRGTRVHFCYHYFCC